VDGAGDMVVETAGNGTADRVAVRGVGNFALAAGVSIELFTTANSTATTAVNLTGNELAQTIVGNAGDNTLGDGGGAGADLLRGLGGNDNYVVYNSATQIIEASTQGAADRIYAGRDYVLADGVFVELLTTTSQFATYSRDIEGNTYGQTIVGNDGQNTLGDGGGSAANGDTLVGGGGNDLYIVRNAGSIVLEAAGEGIDRVSTSVNFTLSAGSHVESINTTSRSATSALQLTGNELGQTLQGNAGANVLYGMAGADTLLGEDGADTLVGGAGVDALSGMGGGDVFAFMASDSTVGFEDTITDFSGAGGDIDQIDLSAFASSFIGAGPFTNTAGEVIFFDNGVNTYVQADSDGVNGADFSVILTGLHVLTASDFLLGP
ncbi:MAG: calcium-binding protein, partial [Planctomycetales bacterium]|nr:calcium-binding protein [Planctomycetales bacterium]